MIDVKGVPLSTSSSAKIAENRKAESNERENRIFRFLFTILLNVPNDNSTVITACDHHRCRLIDKMSAINRCAMTVEFGY